MKILFLGHLEPGQTSLMRMRALQRLGHEVQGINSQKVWQSKRYLSRHLQQRLGHGQPIRSLNNSVLDAARAFRPHMLWAEKQEFLRGSTVRALGSMGIRTLHFTPDPYYSLPWKRTSIADEAMTLFDHVVTPKTYELAEYARHCANVAYMPLGYDDVEHRPMAPAPGNVRHELASDVCFVGGWEARRERYLSAVADDAGQLKIWGYAWDHLQDGRRTLRRVLRLRRLAGDEPYAIALNPKLAPAIQGGEIQGAHYCWALSGGRVGVGFLRKVCADQHTTRTFEIPACGSMLLADRSDEHSELFREGVEADFFSSVEEFREKLAFYLRHEDVRGKVAARGYERCISGRYSYRERIADLLARLEA